MEAEDREALREAKQGLLRAKKDLGELRRRADELRREASDLRFEANTVQLAVKDTLTDLANRGLIEWESPYRDRQTERVDS